MLLLGTIHQPATLGYPIECFPAERIFSYPASTKSNVWQLATLSFHVYTNGHMLYVGFQVFAPLVGFVVQYRGPPPSHRRGKFVWSKYTPTEPGKPPKPLRGPDWWFSD